LGEWRYFALDGDIYGLNGNLGFSGGKQDAICSTREGFRVGGLQIAIFGDAFDLGKAGGGGQDGQESVGGEEADGGWEGGGHVVYGAHGDAIEFVWEGFGAC
jgi:hypothetical protein